MIKNVLIMTIIFIFTACSVKQPYKTEYILQMKNFTHSKSSGMCADKTIQIEQAFANQILNSTKMSYIVGKHKRFYFTQAQWANPIKEMVTTKITTMMEQLEVFKNVQNYRSRTDGDYILEINIIDFQQYFTQELELSFVKVNIKFTIIDLDTNKVLYGKTFVSKKDVETLDARGGVLALNAALEEILVESSHWIETKVCN